LIESDRREEKEEKHVRTHPGSESIILARNRKE